MPTMKAGDWIDLFWNNKYTWYVKRLSGNDTLANKSHQAGPYVPKKLLFSLFPELHDKENLNPRIEICIYLDSHSKIFDATVIWYNGKLFTGTRNEARITNLGGMESPILDPESTGQMCVFAFGRDEKTEKPICHVWLVDETNDEIDLFEERTGVIEPGKLLVFVPGVLPPQTELFGERKPTKNKCWLDDDKIPPNWLVNFPSGREVVRKTIELRSSTGVDVDERLIARRECEFEVFKSVEQAFWLPKVKSDFRTIEDFLTLAQSILQARKSRSGNSLEYHLAEIFSEEGLIKGKDFAHTPSIEGGKKPDFIFPSVTAYEDSSFPKEKLRMLAAKTTCKDRWRQVINEADRIPLKHLITLQEGVSEAQFREMQNAGVELIVPKGLHESYAKTIRPELKTLEWFMADLRLVL